MFGQMANCTDAGKTLTCKVQWIEPPNQLTMFTLVQNTNNAVTAVLVTPDQPVNKVHNLTCDTNAN